MNSKIPDSEKESWAATNALRLSAAFRHYSQSSLRRRSWVPQAHLFDQADLKTKTKNTAIPDQEHRRSSKAPSDQKAAQRKQSTTKVKMRMIGKQSDPQKQAAEQQEQDDDDDADESNDEQDEGSEDKTSTSSSSSSSSSAGSQNSSKREAKHE